MIEIPITPTLKVVNLDRLQWQLMELRKINSKHPETGEIIERLDWKGIGYYTRLDQAFSKALDYSLPQDVVIQLHELLTAIAYSRAIILESIQNIDKISLTASREETLPTRKVGKRG